MIRKIAIIVLGTTLIGCGEVKRDNPFDPGSGQEIDLGQLLIGTWSRDDAEANEIYVFKGDGRVELRSYSAPGGGEVDRQASYPQTLEARFSGTYTLAGNLLRISFSNVTINDPDGVPPALPLTDRVVEISVQDNTLILHERDGNRAYTRV